MFASSRLICWDTADGVNPRAVAAAATVPWSTRAARARTPLGSIMKRYYRFTGKIIRWYFMVAVLMVGPVNRRDVLLGLALSVAWGVNFVVIDEGLPGVPPLLFAAIRFACVSLLVFFVARPKASWRYVTGVGLFMSAGQFGLFYLALAVGMPAGLRARGRQAQGPLTILLAAAVYGERVSNRQRLGLAVALTGL